MKKALKILTVLVFFVAVSTLIESCNKDDGKPAIDPAFNEYVETMDIPEQPEESDEAVLEEWEEEEEGNIFCTVQKIYAAPGSEEFLLYNPTSDILWPGSLLRLESIDEGSFIPIIAKRRPMTFSVSLENINGTPSCTMQNPNLSNARECINDILNQGVSGATPAGLTFSVDKVYSEDQSKLALGASIGGLWGKVKSSFDFNDRTKNTLYIVKFHQVYYSIDINIPASPSDWFEEAPPTNTLGSYSPVYISSIKYGRMLYFMVQSSESYSKVEAALEASFNSWKVGGEIQISAEHENTIQSSTIKGLAIGGPSDGTVGLVSGISGLTEYLSKGANYSSDSPGAPVAFSLRFLKDNSIAKVVLATEYTRRICEYVPPNTIPVEIFPNNGNYYETGEQLGKVNLIDGNNDYGGDGWPRIYMDVKLMKSDKYIDVQMHFLFKEERADRSTGETLKSLRIYNAPSGWKVNKILTSDSFYMVQPEDNGHGPKVLNFGSGLVQAIVVNGDTGGPDLPGEFVGQDRSWLQVRLNKVVVELIEE